MNKILSKLSSFSQRLIIPFFCFSILLLALQIIKIWVADVCRIPSTSMENIILAGDRILVSKIGCDKIKRNELIIFNHPDGGGTQLIKRCIGLPGDTVKLRNGMVYINGSPIFNPLTVKQPAKEDTLNFPLRCLEWTTKNYGPVITPAKGLSLLLDSVNKSLYNHFIRIEKNGNEQPYELPDGDYVFETDGYFVLGDNRGNSIDSRYWGFVPKDLIVGKAVLVYFSKDLERNKIRWRRIGKLF